MRSVAAVFTFLCTIAAVAGCSGSDGDAQTPPVDTGGTTEPDIDTGWPPGDIANIHVAYHANTGQTGVYAAFTQSSPGYVNMAECAIRGSLCIPDFASELDEYEDLDTDQEIDQETTVTRFAGFDITVGPYTLPYREDPDTKFGYYFLEASGQELPEGWIGASWGGQWPEYTSTEDLFVLPPIEIIQPALDAQIVFTNGQTVPLEWVPTGEGIVTLTVFTRFTLTRMYKVEDDGYFALDADSLGLAGDTEDLTFVFTRWTQNQIIEKGNVVNFVSSSDAMFTGEYIQIGARTQVSPADECPQAQGSLALETGNWWGYLGGGINNDLDPNNGCLFGGVNFEVDARGNDALFRIDVPGHYAVSVDYNLFDESASVYFLNDCDNVNSCFVGNDTSADPNVHEFLSFFNPEDPESAPRSIYLVIDASDPGDSIFTLDITNEELRTPTMYDSCEEAQAPPPADEVISAGNYYANFTSYTDDLNPGTGGCTGTSLPGNDSMTAITLQSGEVLTVSVDMADGDPGLYLLYNCQDEFSCPAGADVGGEGDPETITYTNASAGSENLYIVVDSKTGISPYFLSVTIN